MALGTDLLYGKENIEKYKEHTDTINNLSEQVKAADELKENLDLSRKEKEKLRDNYKVDDEMLKDLAEKQAAIDAIKADGEYDDKLTALKNAQQNYNDALSDGVSADNVNAAVLKIKQVITLLLKLRAGWVKVPELPVLAWQIMQQVC